MFQNLKGGTGWQQYLVGLCVIWWYGCETGQATTAWVSPTGGQEWGWAGETIRLYANVLITPVIGWINWGEDAYRLASGCVVPTTNKADLDRCLLSVKKQCQQTRIVWTHTSPATIKSTMYLWGIHRMSPESSTMSDHRMAGTSGLEVVPGDDFWQQTDCSPS